MEELELPDLFAAAARATINEHSGAAYVHDIRGTLQALFGAIELLARSAKSGADPARTEKACDLAKRALSQHEQSTLRVLELLTLHQAGTTVVDIGALLSEVAHFLRQDSAMREVKVVVSAAASDLHVSVERAKLQTLLVGLMTDAIEGTPSGAELPVSAQHLGGEVSISIGYAAGYGSWQDMEVTNLRPPSRLRSRDLTLLFAHRFLATNQGRLEIDPAAGPRGTLTLIYPTDESQSFAARRVSATEK